MDKENLIDEILNLWVGDEAEKAFNLYYEKWERTWLEFSDAADLLNWSVKTTEKFIQYILGKDPDLA